MIDPNERGKDLAEAHWHGYVGPMLKEHGVDEATIWLCQFYYLTAFLHGFKHGYAEALAEFQKGEDDGAAE